MLARLRAFFNPQDERTLPRRILWVALVVRVLYITLAHTYRIRLAEDHFQFGWEAGRIARALVTGYGYSDPFANAFIAHTGPTAWLPPLYPLLLAAIFKLFGVYTHASAWVLLTIQSIFSAATAVATYEIAARCFNRRVALWSAWLWALYPAAMQYAVRWPWEMSITTCLFAFTLVLALRMRSIGDEPPSLLSSSSEAEGPASPGITARTSNWLLFGLLWGLIALSNSTLLIFLPVCGLWILLPHLRDPRAYLGPTLAALLFLACIAPWTLRNWQAFHVLIPLRGNLGAEMAMGNGPGSNGLLMEYYHPFQAPEQLRLYASLGEVRYVAQRGTLAKAYIAAHPAHFAAVVVRRIYFFWAGVPHPTDEAWDNELGRTLNFDFLSIAGLLGLALALLHRIPAVGLFAWAFLLLPIPYYLVTVHARFRHPLEPLICILAVYLFQSAERPRHTA
ncbi:MAG TPA: glycosyltransferase family 39 protein [Acidobacteriaceae bacterium]|jgi:4-amino-4-deoxy-L-arabinose transferase-like glycosyltransferase|nr:glycosyltransferase family 39 protein [Acidobacteriaceae bacterium]